ncbi:MAG: hypothetical protein QOG70_1515 [Solirubrobacteraceae bacterium]|jgi:hypothetical protein|nr:hypothetical protein [Solirubrobacteraceae bacterium]
MRLPAPRVILFAAAGLALLPASASASGHAVYPVVKSISPVRLAIGQTLTIKGSGFRAGKDRNTVVFKRDGKPAIFVKADTATKTRLQIVVPDKLAAFLATQTTGPIATRFRVRVLSQRFSKSFTSDSKSPIITPRTDAAPGGAGAGSSGPTLSPYQLCQQSAVANPDADNDADGIANSRELAIGTDPCNADTDGDGFVDGYEYQSALDLNGSALPFPGKRPWPNPLDPSDGNYDFDGDGLMLWQEYALWKKFSNAFPVTMYSDGTQNTGGPMLVVTAEMTKLDLNGDGNLTDDERDADADGLSNVVEYNYRGTQAWWPLMYTTEKPYNIRSFSQPDPLLNDTDGDGIPDGQDDQDGDGFTNYQEMQQSRSQIGLRVQPYNPCLPNPYAALCSKWVPFTNAWPPFDDSQQHGDAVPFVWKRPSTQPLTGGWNGTGGYQGPTAP